MPDPIATPLTRKMTLNDFRAARERGTKLAMLTCHDYTTACLMQEAGVPSLLVGDSAANVILGHDSTLPISLDFLIELTAAVRRGAPLAVVIGDLPFGSYQASVSQGVRSACRMIRRTGCDAVKLEVSDGHVPLVRALADAGVAVITHLGLKPQSVGLLGGYKFQGRTAAEASAIVASALQMEKAGAAMILLEAVPSEVANAVVERTTVPIVGCGAGPDCHSSVIVAHDGLGLTQVRPRFVPSLAELSGPMIQAFATYVRNLDDGTYPQKQHEYAMAPAEKANFEQARRRSRGECQSPGE